MKYRLAVEFEHDGPVKRRPLSATELADLLGAMRRMFGVETFSITEIRLEDA